MPLQLTDFGETIAEALDAADWVTRTGAELETRTAGLEPFEIDQVCANCVEDLDGEWRRRIARATYELGTTTAGVEAVLRVLLRNQILGQQTAEQPVW